ncbi:HemK2/MTQ2 family protein methyltransferase [Streptomyces sp. NPDC059897]|uniref:HemK2/MTQ2 family protein methyltransferase n=1 Tax=Streptomyces sp. NPDC059897 TaxID=3346994 RepID=UPI00365E0835
MTTHPTAGDTAPLPRRRRLLAPRGVYKPCEDTGLLLRALGHEAVAPYTAVLDLGTGSGALALAAARHGARVTAVDISWRAVWTTRLNALLDRATVTVRHGDLGAVPDLGAYDLALSNPPYVPSPGTLPPRGAARAWDGGLRGRRVVDRVCVAAARALRPGGTLLMVHSTLCGEDETLEHLAGLGMKAAVVDRAFVPFGPVVRAHHSWLCAQGLLDREATKEELVVIRAELV